ncbi:MAG: type II toxin-antitoxin system VapC family toxin [Proteobacteria bacterium]|nr:VapC toxin family PIN domain ribonuclease [Methylibium sp.]MBY0366754.1 type II toxin-antitoxin system VapC family toxin [Burkholderiaceae bacterium]MCH8854823.1 type II toxin-antitoxin system VapC family toxin [Pseudomonadota bacterium]
MILLDTNVVSEPMKPRPDPTVLAWLDDQSPQTLYLSSIALAELLAGVAALPAGKRRTALALALEQQVLPLFEGRVLAFDVTAARAYPAVHAGAAAAGNPISFADGAIAAIAAARGFAVATRNVRDFNGTGVALINPWESDGAG